MKTKVLLLAALIVFCGACARAPVRKAWVPTSGSGVAVHIDKMDTNFKYAKVSIDYFGVNEKSAKVKAPSQKFGNRRLNILVIPARFADSEDIPRFATFDWMKNMMFGTSKGGDDRNARNSVKNYFAWSSSGKVKLSGDIYEKWAVVKKLSDYREMDNQNDLPTQIVQDAISTIDVGYWRGKSYDFVVCLMPGGFWSIYKGGWYEQLPHWRDPSWRFKGYLVMEMPVEKDSFYGMEPKRRLLLENEQSANSYGLKHSWWYGSFLHELFHGIGPYVTLSDVENYADLYQPPFELVKEYDLMSGGNHNSVNGYNEPSFFSGYTKMKLGFVKPRMLKFGNGKRIKIKFAEGNSGTRLVKVPLHKSGELGTMSLKDRTFSGEEYLLIELRKKGEISGKHNFDAGLPHEGVAIYHIIEGAPKEYGNDAKNLVQLVDLSLLGPSLGVVDYVYRLEE